MDPTPNDQNNKEIFNIQLQSAMDHIKLAEKYESEDLNEAACKHYVIASTKLMELIKSEKDPRKIEVFKKHLNNCLTQAGFLKITISDQKKSQLIQNQILAPCNQPIGFGCLGNQYIVAYEYYKHLGDYYFNMATQKGFLGVLPAVKKCFVIAGQNLKSIMDVVGKDSDKYFDFRAKFEKTLSFAEEIQKKIQNDPIKYDVQKKYMAGFNQHEQTIINAASICRDINYDLWSPALGITNIYSQKQFIDSNGMLRLSVKQGNKLKHWVRLIDVLDKSYFINGIPDVATQITGYEVQQKGVGDCSVLCSLAVLAHHELKFNYQVKLISNNIFPQDQNGNPIYNPEGKYIVKLYLNGSWRGVEVDDYIPVDNYQNPICAYSNKGKMWISLIEKAYLKAHGGYDFDGSLSSRDLFILTGWLPENIDLKEYDTQKLWKRIYNGYKNRDCLITCGTGPIENEDEIGLASSHAYAILEIMEYKSTKMLLVKNPWGHFRYKGKFSVDDKVNWTVELKNAFNYKQLINDNGVFWVDIDTFVRIFEHLCINWNPNLLTYRKSFFDLWKSADMSQENVIKVKKNPQYQIKFISSGQPVQKMITWIAITKLLIRQNDVEEDAENSKDYLAMHVYKADKPGQKMYNASNPLIKSTYKNEQTIMLYIQDLNPQDYIDTGKMINLVLDQTERKKDLYFKVEIFSSQNFSADRLGKKFAYKYELAVPQLPISGGVPSDPFFYKNPQYLISLDTEKQIDKQKILTLQIETVITYTSQSDSSVKIYLSKSGIGEISQGHKGRVYYVNENNIADKEQLSRPYERQEYISNQIISGHKHYTAIVSNFDRSDPMGGTITLESDQQMIFQPVVDEGAGMIKQVFSDEWNLNNSGGCMNFGTYDKNPAYCLRITQDGTNLMFRMMVTQETDSSGTVVISDSKKFNYCVSAKLYRIQSNVFPLSSGSLSLNQLKQALMNTYEDGNYTNNLSACISPVQAVSAGVYVIVASTFNPQQIGKFALAIYSSTKIECQKYQ